MAEPLVSVMLPCYNAAETLPRALASLLAQEYQNWECVLVDDGSRDRPEEVVERFADPRIRVIRLEQNHGRPVARQTALEHARGELLAMLDADDWLYPWKLRVQVEVLDAEPGLALVTSGFAIVDERNELVACRQNGDRRDGAEVRGPHRTVGPPRIPHGPSLLRLEDARRTGYDLRLDRAQDADFLQRLLFGRRYGVWGEPLYAYAEYNSFSREAVETAFRCRRLMFRKQVAEFPVASRVALARDALKLGLYRAAFSAGLGERMLTRRSRTPSAEERQRFEEARAAVDGTLAAS